MTVVQERKPGWRTWKRGPFGEVPGWCPGRAWGHTSRFVCEKKTKENGRNNCKLPRKSIVCVDLNRKAFVTT